MGAGAGGALRALRRRDDHGSRAAALAALGPDGPDGDGPTPAAPSARPALWLIVCGQSVPRELTPEEAAELDAFIDACTASAPLPEPCIACGRPASPYEATDAGPLCWRCWPPPGPTPPAPVAPTGRALATIA